MSKGLEQLERLAYENACCRCQYWGKKGCPLLYQNNECPCAWLEIKEELEAFHILIKACIDENKRKELISFSCEDLIEAYKTSKEEVKNIFTEGEYVHVLTVLKKALL